MRSNPVSASLYVIPKKILFADRFAEDSSHALGYVRAIALRFESHVTVAYIVPPATPLTTPEGATPESLGCDVLEPDEQLVQRVEDLRAEGISADSVQRIGAVESELVALAKERSSDLLILGTHAPHGLDRLFFGSDAERVADSSGWPVMIVGPSAAPAHTGKWEPQRLLCVLEESACSIAAAVYAVRLSQAMGAETTFYIAEQEAGEISSAANGFVSLLSEKLPSINIGFDIERRYIRSGRLLESVVDRCRLGDIGAVVMCAELEGPMHTHLCRHFLSKLLANAPCPVIVTGRGATDQQN